MTCLVYVYDCLFFEHNEDEIGDELTLLREPKPNSLSMSEESDVAGFLGILMEKAQDGIELKQEGLIKRIITSLGLEDCSPKLTPSEKTPLGKDTDGPPRNEEWNYRSVLGMIQYLATNSRPDIAFAVNQCSRFSMDPRRSHEKAVKRIGRYLKGTQDRGMVIRPDPSLGLDLYADADFAGLYTVEDSEDPVCVKSRTGWVVTLGGVPVTWGSKLQTEIALSTMEAEYIALSTGMRELVGSRKIKAEITLHGGIKRNAVSRVSRAYEDNMACCNETSKVVTKDEAHSREISLVQKKIEVRVIEIHPIGTKMQKADIFTKGLTADDFREKRKMLLGW